jgi:hypothetical protein
MQEFSIENGDGIVDKTEFIILAAVRIGTASPDLVMRINSRFKQLDQKHAGKISYGDLIDMRRKSLPIFALTVDIKQVSTRNLHSGVSSGVSSVHRARNSSFIFMTRAKSVFEPRRRSSVAKIAANIAKIENFVKSTRPSSPTSSRRSTALGKNSRWTSESNCNSDSDSDSDSDKESGKERDKYAIHVRGRDVEEGGGTELKRFGDSEISERFGGRISSTVNFTRKCMAILEKGRDSLDDFLEDGEEKEEDEEEDKKSDSNVDKLAESSLEVMSDSFNRSLSRLSSMSLRKASSDPLDVFDDEVCSDRVLVAPSPHHAHTTVSQTYSSEDSKDRDDRDDENSDREEQENSPTKMPPPSDLKTMVKKQKRLNQESHSLEEIVEEIVAETRVKSKHHEKMQQAKKERRQSRRETFKNRKKGRLVLMVLAIRRGLKSSSAIAFYLWFLWLLVGTVFYSLEENLTVCKAIYVSTSIGYGIFWYDQTSTNNYAKLFSMFHFSIGLFGVAFAMAVFARSLISRKKQWFDDAKQMR